MCYFCEVCGVKIVSDGSLQSLPEKLVVYTKRLAENSDPTFTRVWHNRLIVCSDCRSVLVAMIDAQIDSLKREMQE